jgi:hypothetical protein
MSSKSDEKARLAMLLAKIQWLRSAHVMISNNITNPNNDTTYS